MVASDVTLLITTVSWGVLYLKIFFSILRVCISLFKLSYQRKQIHNIQENVFKDRSQFFIHLSSHLYLGRRKNGTMQGCQVRPTKNPVFRYFRNSHRHEKSVHTCTYALLLARNALNFHLTSKKKYPYLIICNQIGD